VVGALATLWLVGAPFGFMAFLGIASLIGVIVSHIIVLFDFIEEMHAKGEPLEEALLDAGIVRLRPVLITGAATSSRSSRSRRTAGRCRSRCATRRLAA
jgi:multidrug efflux pump subunit AcrB